MSEQMPLNPSPDGRDPREERLQALYTAADPTAEPSEALQARVAELAARHATAVRPSSRAHRGGRTPTRTRRFQWTPFRLAIGLAAAIVLALLLTTLTPKWTAAQVLRRAGAAMDGVRSAHTVSWRISPDGRRTKTWETWNAGEQWRSDSLAEGRIQIYADGKLWSYQPGPEKVTVQRQDGPATYNASGLTLAARKRDFARWGWRDTIRVLGETTIDGRPAREVVIERAGEWTRQRVLVDAATDLPIRTEVQLRVDGRWQTQILHEHRYNEALPPELFNLDFARSARVFDIDRNRRVWERRLARGIARERVGDRTIVIRDLQVNAEGDVFVLYTAGKYLSDALMTGNYLAGRDWQLELTDDLGTLYLARRGSYWPTLAHQHPKLPNGFTFNGERIEGDVWIPLVPQTPWQPRRFTLTFHVHPVNLHGGREDPPVKATYTETATFTLAVPYPSAAIAPAYMRHMAMPIPATQVPRERALARAHYYEIEREDLPQALEWYREITRITASEAREQGEPTLDPQTWQSIGNILRKMDRKAEARTAFERALRESIYPGYSRQQAEAGLKALRDEQTH